MPSIREMPWALLRWSARRRLVEGLEVCVAYSVADPEEVFARVGDALRLIATHGPRFSARLRRDVKALLFADVSGGRYIAGLRTCLIGVGYVRGAIPLDLAMMIVHEASHARLSRSGFRYVGECRARIERICVAAEIAFARRVPGSEASVEKTQALLETEWWRPDQSAEDTLAELRQRRVPSWLMSMLRRVNRWTGVW